jgi:hypothetical protein
VAVYTFASFWNFARSLLARGLTVANFCKANCSGDKFESAKFIEEKEMPAEVTSGTLEIVVFASLQVILEARELAAS